MTSIGGVVVTPLFSTPGVRSESQPRELLRRHLTAQMPMPGRGALCFEGWLLANLMPCGLCPLMTWWSLSDCTRGSPQRRTAVVDAPLTKNFLMRESGGRGHGRLCLLNSNGAKGTPPRPATAVSRGAVGCVFPMCSAYPFLAHRACAHFRLRL